MNTERTEYLLTQLVDAICSRKGESHRVIYDHFLVTKHQMIQELNEAYTEREIREFEQRINDYGFTALILSITEPERDDSLEW